MQRILFITLIVTASITYTAESDQSLILQFANDLALTCHAPFLHRFTTLHNLPKKQTNTDQFSVTYQKSIDSETAFALKQLITKPINELILSNPHGRISNALLDAAFLLGIRANGTSDEQQALTQFRAAFLQTVIQKNAVVEWCIDAKKTLIETKKVPALEDNQSLSKLKALMHAAKISELSYERSLIYETAYETGLMNTLYTHMYGMLSPIIRQRPRSKINSESASHQYLETMQSDLFASPAWHYYATLHGAYTPDTYTDLLYGNPDTPDNDTLLPTRHYHLAFHDNIQESRHEHDHAGKPLMPHEITTCYRKNINTDGLRFKQMQASLNGLTQTIFFTYFDAILLQEIIKLKKPSYLYYDLSGENREVSVAPKAVALFASFPSALRINLGTISPDNAETIEKHVLACKHTQKITSAPYSGTEYKQFHRHNASGSIHKAIKLEKPVTTIIFLDKDNKRGAQLTYAIIDDTLTCSC